MDAVLKKLESKIEELITAYTQAAQRADELAARVEELEKQLANSSALGERVAEFETQRSELASRLEKVLELVDSTLASHS